MWKGLSLFEGDELMEGKIKCFDSKSLKKDMRRKSHNFIDASKLRLGSGVLDLLDIDVSKVTWATKGELEELVDFSSGKELLLDCIGWHNRWTR